MSGKVARIGGITMKRRQKGILAAVLVQLACVGILAYQQHEEAA